MSHPGRAQVVASRPRRRSEELFDAVPNDATGYVAAAYVFFLAIVLIYIAIIGAKLERIGRELTELTDHLEEAGDLTPAESVANGGEGVG